MALYKNNYNSWFAFTKLRHEHLPLLLQSTHAPLTGS